MVIVSKKLRPCFDAHQVVILTNLPLEKSLDKIEKSVSLSKCTMELNGLGVKCQSRTTINGQVLAEILAKWLLTNRSFRLVGVRTGLILITLKRKTIEYAQEFQLKTTNNEAYYEGVNS